LDQVGTARVRDAASFTVLTFVGTFGVWLLAARANLSPIITMVAYGMTLSREASHRGTARNRVSTYSVWETAVFVLNVLAFVIMGLQARPILSRLSQESLAHALLVSGAVLATVIVVRIVYLMTYTAVGRLTNRWFGVTLTSGTTPPTVAGGLLVSWCGMRGLVTLSHRVRVAPRGPPPRPDRPLRVLRGAWDAGHPGLHAPAAARPPRLRDGRRRGRGDLARTSRHHAGGARHARGRGLARGGGRPRRLPRRAQCGCEPRRAAGRDRARPASLARDRSPAADAAPPPRAG